MFATPRARSERLVLLFTVLAFIPLVLLLAQTPSALAAGVRPAPPMASPLYKPNIVFVTNNNDSGAGSLRDAIANAGLFDTIYFAPNVSGTITLTSGELFLPDPVSIVGPGESVLAISGNNSSRVINIGDNNYVDISGLTIKEGRLFSDSIGAGILVSGDFFTSLSSVNLTNVSIISNTVADAPCGDCYGAGLANLGGTVNLTNVTIKGNQILGTPDCTECGGAGIINVYFMNLNNVSIQSNGVQAIGGTCFDCFGAGIDNEIMVSMMNSKVTDNLVSGSICGECFGGGMDNESTANLTNVTFSGNSITYVGVAPARRTPSTRRNLNGKISAPRSRRPQAPANGSPLGGAIFNFGLANLNNVTLNGNLISPVGAGGAIHNDGEMNITNVTISGNYAYYGGGISNSSFNPSPIITFTNVTLNANSASLIAGNIANGTGTIFLRNTIVANSSGAPNCSVSGGAILDDGNNLQTTDTSCGGTIPVADPMLAPLGNFGGPTKTHPPFAGSPALNAANDLLCPPFDQRGSPRVQGPHCDIGAVEFGSGLRLYNLPLILKNGTFP